MNYYHTQILLVDFGYLPVSHFCFQPGSLVSSEVQACVTKPLDYEKYYTKRKETFLAGRLAVRDAQVCLKVPVVPIMKAIKGEPVWPSEYTGSISHTDTQAVAVLLPLAQNRVKGIGIDIELISSASQLEMAQMIGTTAEFQKLAEIDIPQPLATLLLFSLKESVYKALYPIVGEFFDFLDAELVAINEGRGILRIKRRLSEQVQKDFLIKGGFTKLDDSLLTWAYW